MDKIREDFNEWIDALDFKQLDDLCEQSAWAAWQASRQALVVELPENGETVFKNDFAEGVSSGANIYRSAVECALDKQGIKYK